MKQPTEAQIAGSHAALTEQLDLSNRQLKLYSAPQDTATLQLIASNERLLTECKRLFTASGRRTYRKEYLPMKFTQYLADGVYASFDGFSVVLTTGHHDPAQAKNVIVLEPEVLAALEAWSQRLGEAIAQHGANLPDRA